MTVPGLLPCISGSGRTLKKAGDATSPAFSVLQPAYLEPDYFLVFFVLLALLTLAAVFSSVSAVFDAVFPSVLVFFFTVLLFSLGAEAGFLAGFGFSSEAAVVTLASMLVPSAGDATSGWTDSALFSSCITGCVDSGCGAASTGLFSVSSAGTVFLTAFGCTGASRMVPSGSTRERAWAGHASTQAVIRLPFFSRQPLHMSQRTATSRRARWARVSASSAVRSGRPIVSRVMVP